MVEGSLLGCFAEVGEGGDDSDEQDGAEEGGAVQGDQCLPGVDDDEVVHGEGAQVMAEGTGRDANSNRTYSNREGWYLPLPMSKPENTSSPAGVASTLIAWI